MSPPNGWANIGDAQSVVLPNGKYMLANALTTQQALLNASTMTWTPTGSGKFDVNDEEGWTLLQDGTVFTADGYVVTGTCGRNTERYNPATGAWKSAGNSPVQLSDCSGFKPSYEVGPQVLRADGSVVLVQRRRDRGRRRHGDLPPRERHLVRRPEPPEDQRREL